MRKGLTIFSLILIILIVFSQLLLPTIAAKTLQSRLTMASKARAMQVQVSAMPAVLLLFGQIDQLDIAAEQAMLGQVRVDSLKLTGRNVSLPVDVMVSGQLAVRAADELNLSADVTADDLLELLQRKVDKLQNAEVTIAPELITVSGQAKILGRMADIRMEGQVLEEDGNIYFRMTKLDIKNAILGKALLGNFFGDIMLVDLKKLSLPVELDDVLQQDGQVVLTASRHK